MTSHHEDILSLLSEQRRCQQAVLIECLVRTAPRSPPLFRLEQRHGCLNARGPTKMVYYLASRFSFLPSVGVTMEPLLQNTAFERTLLRNLSRPTWFDRRTRVRR